MSFKVPGRLLTDGQCRMMINGIQFIQVLLEANGLAAGKDHQFKGRFQPVKRDTDHLQTVMSTVEEAGDVMYLSQNVVETFIDRIEVFNDEHVKIHFTFENVLADYAE